MDRRLLTLALGMFALGTDNFVFAGVLPQIARSFEVSIEAAGQMTTAYALTYALLAPVFAALMSSVPRKRLLLVALAIFVIANLATALAPSSPSRWPRGSWRASAQRCSRRQPRGPPLRSWHPNGAVRRCLSSSRA
jgi:MFS family permease